MPHYDYISDKISTIRKHVSFMFQDISDIFIIETQSNPNFLIVDPV